MLEVVAVIGSPVGTKSMQRVEFTEGESCQNFDGEKGKGKQVGGVCDVVGEDEEEDGVGEDG